MLPLAIVFFFFFRLITDFVEAIYAFGLLGTDIPPEIAAVVLFFTPALLLLFRRTPPRAVLVVLGGIVLVAGAAAGMLDTRLRMLVSGLGVGAFLVFLPSLLAWQGQEDRQGQLPWGASLTLGLALTALTRAWNSGVDPFIQPLWQVLAWLLAITAMVLLPRLLSKDTQEAGGQAKQPQRASPGRLTGLAIGVIACLTMLYFAFSNPSALTRWTDASYPYSFGLVALALILWPIFFSLLNRGIVRISPTVVLAWNFVFVFFLVLAILLHQQRLPSSPEAYPVGAPGRSILPDLPFYGLILLFPILLLNFSRYSHELILLGASIRQLGGAFVLASLFLVLMVFAAVFTTVYDYIPVVGPFWRDRFWMVFLLLGLGLALPALLIRGIEFKEKVRKPSVFVTGVSLLGLAGFAGVLALLAQPGQASTSAASLRVLTYNIQQGYDAYGQKAYLAQAELMRQVDADVIGLQETDTARISGGNADLVRYFADKLDLYSYYGPDVVDGTFGIALLSKYPIIEPRTFYMYSVGEQTAAIQAQVSVGGKTYNVLVTHLGNSGPIEQQEAVLKALEGLENVVAMGDFNFRPDTEQYRLTTSVLLDAWLLRWPSGLDDQEYNPARRIDHIFVSGDVEVLEARYLTGPESDHPALVVEIRQ